MTITVPLRASDIGAALVAVLCLGCEPAQQGREPAAEAWGPRGDVQVPRIAFQPRTYTAFRAPATPAIDGRLNDHAWSGAPWSADFVDIEGPTQPAPRFRTRAKIIWDDAHLYVAAELEEPHVWGTLTERDAVIYHDNDFEIFIDPDGDTHEYYELEINALGTVWDLFLVRPYRDGGPALDAWDVRGLEAAVWVDGSLNDPRDRDGGWDVEIAVPWAMLDDAAHRPVPPAPGDRWRMNFSRVQWRHTVEGGRYAKVTKPRPGRDGHVEDNWVWSPQGLINMHYPEMWGIVEFSGRTQAPEGRAFDAPLLLPEDSARWALRGLYYAQRAHRGETGTFARRIDALDLANPGVDGMSWPPTMWATAVQFTAAVTLDDGRTLRIRDDGKVW